LTPAGVAVTVEADVRLPLLDAFRRVQPIDLAKIFPRYGPLPAVMGTVMEGGWDHVGARRTVQLSDGSSAQEELTAYLEPSHFAYRLSGITSPLGLLVTQADGAWWFTEPVAGTTHIRWTYIFQPRPGRALVVRALIAPLWERYQRRALALSVREAEQG
jgi:hypothetical protein